MVFVVFEKKKVSILKNVFCKIVIVLIILKFIKNNLHIIKDNSFVNNLICNKKYLKQMVLSGQQKMFHNSKNFHFPPKNGCCIEKLIKNSNIVETE